MTHGWRPSTFQICPGANCGSSLPRGISGEHLGTRGDEFTHAAPRTLVSKPTIQKWSVHTMGAKPNPKLGVVGVGSLRW